MEKTEVHIWTKVDAEQIKNAWDSIGKGIHDQVYSAVDLEIIEENGANGIPGTLSLYQMPEAYLVDDYFEYQGTLKGKNESYDGAWNFFLGDSNYGHLVYFAAIVCLLLPFVSWYTANWL